MTTAAARPRGWFRRQRNRLLFLLWIGVLLEGGARVTLHVLRRFKHVEYRALPAGLDERSRGRLQELIQYGEINSWKPSAALGWTSSPNRCVTPDHICQNGRGLRGRREYAELPAPGAIRIAAFGDSFTWGCCGLEDEEIWTARLEHMDPRLEVLNFGVSSYGVDQAYLRYSTEAAWAHPDIVLIDYMPENILRSVNVFRPFLYPDEGNPLSKPRFAFAGNELTEIPNPLRTIEDYRRLLEHEDDVLPRLGEHDDFYRKTIRATPLDALGLVRVLQLTRQQLSYHPSQGTGCPGSTLCPNIYRDSAAFRILTATIERFHGDAMRRGQAPVVVILPDLESVRAASLDGARPYRRLLDRLQEKQLRVIDLLGDFSEVMRSGLLPEDLFDEPTRHYNARGSQVVAEALLRQLRESGLLENRRN
jgi:lysophospholipase L1-like esterase